MIDQIVIIVENGAVVDVIANSDLQYRVVDLDNHSFDEDPFDANRSQMEDEDESYMVAAGFLSKDDEDES